MSKRSKEKKRNKKTEVTDLKGKIEIYKRCLTVGCDIMFVGSKEEDYCKVCTPNNEKNENKYIITSDVVDDFLKGADIAESFWYIATCMLLVNRIWMFSNDMIKGVIPNKRVDIKDKIAYVDSFMEIQDTLIDLTHNFYVPKNIVAGMYKKIPEVGHTKPFDDRIRKYYNLLGVHDKKGILIMLRPIILRFGNIINQYKSLVKAPISLRWLYIEEHIPSFVKAYLNGK